MYNFASMALSNIDIQIIGDFVWDEHMQAHNEKIISDFKYYFSEWLLKLRRIPRSINVNINVNYNPVIGKFDLTFVSTHQIKILESLKDDSAFSNKYFTNVC